MKTQFKPNCKICKKPYLGHSDTGICNSCLRKSRKPQKLKCDCGNEAYVILQANTGIDGVYPVEIPLCKECYQLEINYRLSSNT